MFEIYILSIPLINLNTRISLIIIVKSKKWKVIYIKRPQLRQLRTNLRTILKLAIEDYLNKLSSIEDLYRRKRNEIKFTPSQWKREIQLSRMGNDLLSAYCKSILNCSCGTPCESARLTGKPPHVISLEVDMGWVPPLKHWICAKCHERDYSKKEHRVLLKKFVHNPDLFYH